MCIRDRIYFLEDTTFYLLFDFNPKLGDTVTYYEPINKSIFSTNQVNDIAAGPNKYQIVITDIDTVSIANLSLKKFSTSPIYPDDLLCSEPNTIIESIGSTSQNLTGDQTCYVADGCFGGLQCYNNGQIEYKTERQFETPNPSCGLLDATIELGNSNSIQIFPNPTSNYFDIISQEPILSIELFGISGERIKKYESKNRIQLSDVSSGVYFVKIVSKKSYWTTKLIKE